MFVLELSSFQLETTSSLAPVAATVLNVTENHLDRYAGIDDYAAAKARIFARGGIQVLNRDDPRSLAMRLPGRLVQTFGAGVPESEEAWGLVDRGGDAGGAWLARGGALLLPVADLKLVGRHNAQNALAALALVSAVRQVDRDVAGRARPLRGPAAPDAADRGGGRRRLRRRFEGHDRRRDASRARRASTAPVVLIAGGDGKGQNFAALRDVGRCALPRGAADRPRRAAAASARSPERAPRRALRRRSTPRSPAP